MDANTVHCYMQDLLSFFFLIDVLITMFNCSMGHFLFQSIFHYIFHIVSSISVIFKMFQALRSPMTIVASKEKPWQVIYDQRGSQSVNDDYTAEYISCR